MNIQQGDKFTYQLNNGLPATVQVTSTIGNKVDFRHIHGKSGVGSVTDDYFQQLIDNGYFKKEE